MGIESHDLLTCAKSWYSGATTEVIFRSVASKAYYAALHAVDKTFLEPGEKVNGRDDEGTHDKVAGKALSYSKRAKAKDAEAAAEVAQLLPQCKKARVIADYKLDRPFKKEDAAKVITKSEQICRLCAALRISFSKQKPDEDATPANPIKIAEFVDSAVTAAPATLKARPTLTRLK